LVQCPARAAAHIVRAIVDALQVVFKASIALLVVGVGLHASPRDAAFLLRHPGLFARTLLSMHVVMPLLALLVSALFAIPPVVRLTLLCLAISPIPPFLPSKAGKAGGEDAYTIGLLVSTSLLSILILPLSLEALGKVFGLTVGAPLPALVKIIATTLLGPTAVGMAIRHFWPSAARFGKPLTTIATLLLLVAVVPVVITAWPAFRALIGDGTLLTIILLALCGLASGHLLGGPYAGDRTVLALATATRHPVVAMTIASVNFPGEKLVVPAALLTLIVSAVAAVPYVAWRKRDQSSSAGSYS
jgi:BASS family bile acid:Na+ symporter